MGNHHFEVVRHDVTYPYSAEVDEIYNLACPASPIHYQHDPIQTAKTSVMGAINMLGLAMRLDAKILQASTSEVYGDPIIHPQPESYWGNVNPVGYRSCYDEGKRCAETLFMDYYRQNQTRIKIIRIFNTYGPRMLPNDGRVVSNFIIQALNNEDITIYGDGKQTRSFQYIDDLIEGMVRMMDTDNLEAILQKLEHARIVQLAAVGNTLPVALDGAFKFSQLGITAVAETIWEAQTAHAFNLGPEDVVLMISNSGTSSRLQILAEGAKENGATVILITNNPESPLAQMADYRIITATREKLFTEEFWFSRVAATAVMEILYLLLMAGMPTAAGHVRRHEKAISADKQMEKRKE